MILEKRTRSVEICDDLHVKVSGRVTEVLRGDQVLAGNHPEWCMPYFAMAKQVALGRAKARTVAFLGGGLCVLPSILSVRSWERMDIYEIEPELVKWIEQNESLSCYWNFIIGDWRETFSGTYDVIVYDIPEAPDVARISPHLADGGLKLGW